MVVFIREIEKYIDSRALESTNVIWRIIQATWSGRHGEVDVVPTEAMRVMWAGI